MEKLGLDDGVLHSFASQNQEPQMQQDHGQGDQMPDYELKEDPHLEEGAVEKHEEGKGEDDRRLGSGSGAPGREPRTEEDIKNSPSFQNM